MSDSHFVDTSTLLTLLNNALLVHSTYTNKDKEGYRICVCVFQRVTMREHA